MTREGKEAKYAPFTARAIAILRSIPPGRVAAYGQVAAMAGHPAAARQIVRILHTLSDVESLPWHRVVSKDGTISLPAGGGGELQKALLESEGVAVGPDGRIDLSEYSWSGGNEGHGDIRPLSRARTSD